jgi:hypothetical protein
VGRRHKKTKNAGAASSIDERPWMQALFAARDQIAAFPADKPKFVKYLHEIKAI